MNDARKDFHELHGVSDEEAVGRRVPSFALFFVPVAAPHTAESVPYVTGTAAECALALLSSLSQPERLRLGMAMLSGVEFERLLRLAKRSAGVREAAERAKELVRGTVVHHAEGGALVPPAEDDEPDEPTPLAPAGRE